MRIAHISDTHLCPENGGQRLLDQIVMCVHEALRRGADHVVLTGDLVDYANLEDARALSRRLGAQGLKSPDHVTVVPGNHDVFPVSAHRITLDGDAQRNFEAFEKITRRYARRSERVWSDQPWPFIRQLTRDVLLVAVDSTYSGRLGRLRSGVGELDRQDTEAIIDHLEREHPGCRWRLLVMHHAPHRWRCCAAPSFVPGYFRDVNFEDLPAVTAFIKRGAFDVVLCGHAHGFNVDGIGRARVVRSAWNSVRVASDVTYEGGFHLIDLGHRLRITKHDWRGSLNCK